MPSDATKGLVRDLERAIEDAGDPWLPGFASRLAEEKWKGLLTLGIGPENYGTSRVRGRSANAERDARIALVLPDAFGQVNSVPIETLRAGPAARYVGLGLDLAPPDLAASDAIVSRLYGALGTLSRSPSIAASVGPLLRILHVAIPEGPDYDVSFSDPDVPFSIFVGVSPDSDDGPIARLRLAESMLHEVMHLQLTLVEDILPLVADETVEHHSPWRETPRPVRGVLHGTYVFAVIRDLMRDIQNDDRSIEEERRHAKKRIDAIDSEVGSTGWSMLKGGGLTPTGRRLVRACSP